MKNLKKAVTLNELIWDTEFFGVSCAKATLNKALSLTEWFELKNQFKNYSFISLINKNSEPINAQLIGKDTAGFLVDVNIQFEKEISVVEEKPSNVIIHQALEKNNQVLEIANFQFSKFKEDPELAERGGDQIYQQWLNNSFGMKDKFFALSKNEEGNINGFALFSFRNSSCLIELIAVSQRGGIGSSLFKAVEYEAHQYGCKQIKVGTQIRNLEAINFYHKVGCKQVGCHQVFHIWK
ncbi:GNAT superfamily N-acetyltransferase [Solibacillus kalamii]|uniref:GNAT family N-acetyltransferase n=1 Tax=Solibacillus kalamii TaxID=1748298 RepID=A0ABX3ZKX2_9BACL|nr:GNAT family N-acetyltransferase [Solibacillus kalamii]MBM7665251.1 GNAT superfamily N-acetyltransferase [Solibacillus kalamii]OUZ40390.1 GNAT family N-acetyltransferase [Solibacillus kalamii]